VKIFLELNRLINEHLDSLLDYISPQMRKPKTGVTRDMLSLAFNEKSILDHIRMQKYNNGEYDVDYIDKKISEGYINFDKYPNGKLLAYNGTPDDNFTLNHKIDVEYYLLVIKYLPKLKERLTEIKNNVDTIE
jgi:hypothetical protein